MAAHTVRMCKFQHKYWGEQHCRC